ncbi:uncharacterized protein A4U43_C07F16330 [Asparagus officinalis]|uniref:Peptidase S8/S53 domain-containing protein n=1 Tax=Asparagus officinalis TaxID=4686 RepID=A0A5P1ECD4_ASPOF|nr:uncharacterized protein A4U43_C07F16330 [Asparagus officinalis]
MAHVLETLTSRAVERQSEEADEAGVVTGEGEEPGSEEIGAGTEGAKVVAGNGVLQSLMLICSVLQMELLEEWQLEPVKDGVHILSLSLGVGPEEFDVDAVAIATFAVVRNGIFVAFSVGNSWPDEGSLVNIAPWITTVNAGSIDRKFPTRFTLGSGEVYIGQSLYQQSPNFTRFAPLVYVPQCLMSDTEITQLVKEKILVCENAFVELGMKVAKSRGVSLIRLNGNYSGEGVIVKAFTLPGLTLGYFEAQKLIKYINSTSNPRASLQFDYQTVIRETRAPTVACFSSRGPNFIQPEILKPDILAPGMNILASWPTETPLTRSLKDLRCAGFNIISNTLMSYPHIAGVATLLKA